jgi:hypothetical protein
MMERLLNLEKDCLQQVGMGSIEREKLKEVRGG